MSDSTLKMDVVKTKNYKNWLFLSVFIVVFWLFMAVIVPFVTDKYYDLRYGNVRTYTIAFDTNPTDDPTLLTYFTAQNIEGRISVIAVSPLPSIPTLELESPVLLGEDDENEPITLKTAQVNGDLFPDLIVSVAGDDITYLAENGTFTRQEAIR